MKKSPPQIKESWDIQQSEIACRTINPIRAIVDGMKLNPNPKKNMIALSVGDPTVFGNLPPATEVENAVIKSLSAKKYNGYAPSVGYKEARVAVAKYTSSENVNVNFDDVILTSGCSDALNLTILALASPGDNVLMPRPGFSIYKTLAESVNIEVTLYNLLPDKSWEVDLDHMQTLINEKTKAIIVNNPSNPCGSVYSKNHLLQILAVAEQYKLPIISDEIYEHFVFPGAEYHSMASLSTDVPILQCSGLTKRFLIPGWRMGWVVIHDRHGAFKKEVRAGLTRLSQRILGPNTLIQAAIPDIFANTPADFFEDTIKIIKGNADLSYGVLSSVPGLTPVMPQGAMYMMIGLDMHRFPDFKTDLEFTEGMVTEQSVFCLPAQCFQYPDYFRIVLTIPHDMMRIACERIADFCADHYVAKNRLNGETANGCHGNGQLDADE